MKRADWNHRYRKGEHLDDPPLPLLATTVQGLSPGRALDLACGPGRHTLALGEMGWQVTAVDSSAVAIDLLRRRAAQAGLSIETHLADLEKHEFQIAAETYDLICDTFYLQRDLFAGIRDGLRPGGIFLGVVHMEDPASPPMNPAFLLEPGEFPTHFPGWDIVHYAEGAAQQGHRRVAAELICRKPE